MALKRLVSHVILDLDGTLLKTDGVVADVLRACLADYGKEWDARHAHRVLGKTPLEAAAAVVEDYELPCSAHDLIAKASPMFKERSYTVKALPGAYRLINHLRANGVPMALASNSPRVGIERKISSHCGWRDSFSVIISSEEAKKGKPSPDIFLEAARRMNAEPSDCLVIEDSPPGVLAGKAAGMEVVAVPSLPQRIDLYSAADDVISSLFDLNLGKWGLPPFVDWVHDTLPIEPWFLRGPVVRQCSRGSRILGVPTANLPVNSFSPLPSGLASGMYFGWAALANRGIYKTVMAVTSNPSPSDSEKTIEPWLLHDFDEDFYGEELRLAIVGYMRPEGKASSLEKLATEIHQKGKLSDKVLDLPPYIGYRDASYLRDLEVEGPLLFAMD